MQIDPIIKEAYRRVYKKKKKESDETGERSARETQVEREKTLSPTCALQNKFVQY